MSNETDFYEARRAVLGQVVDYVHAQVDGIDAPCLKSFSGHVAEDVVIPESVLKQANLSETEVLSKAARAETWALMKNGLLYLMGAGETVPRPLSDAAAKVSLRETSLAKGLAVQPAKVELSGAFLDAMEYFGGGVLGGQKNALGSVRCLVAFAEAGLAHNHQLLMNKINSAQLHRVKTSNDQPLMAHAFAMHCAQHGLQDGNPYVEETVSNSFLAQDVNGFQAWARGFVDHLRDAYAITCADLTTHVNDLETALEGKYLLTNVFSATLEPQEAVEEEQTLDDILNAAITWGGTKSPSFGSNN